MDNLNSESARFEKLRRQILPSLNDSTNDEKIKISFPTDLIPPESIDNTLQFFGKVDNLDKSKLFGIFQTINQINIVDNQSPEYAEVARAAEQFVENVLSKVGELDPRFKCSLTQCGSFYDNVKIGKPDEFDFTAKIETLCESDGLEARFSNSKKGFVYVVVSGTTKLDMFSDFIVEAEEDDVLLENEKILSVKKIQLHFSELIDIALKSAKVPKELSPSDANFSWYAISHGPCATVLATFYSEALGKMTLDIDIAPTFDLPDPKFCPPVLNRGTCNIEQNRFQTLINEILQEKAKVRLVPFTLDKKSRQADGKTWTYEYSNKWRVSFNMLEKAIFALYSSDSVEKQMYRVLKAMKDTYIQKSEEVTAKAGTFEMKYEEPPSTSLSAVTAQPLFGCIGEQKHTGFSIQPLSMVSNYELEEGDGHCDKGASGFSFEAVGEYSSKEEETEENTSESENSDYDYDDVIDLLNENPQSKSQAESLQTEILYDRHSSIPNSNPKSFSLINHDIANQSNIESPFKSTTEYRSSKPLIKTYHIKMILFSMKLVFDEEKIWDIENLPSLVLIVIKALYFIYSSNERAFCNFWFQEIIENSERPSVCLEILQALDDMVEELYQKTKVQ